MAKAALRRLALERLQPTPENFARAYHAERGDSPAFTSVPAPQAEGPDGEAWATLIESALRGVERGGRHWTAARRKDSLQRVLGSSRSDAKRLQQRLKQLIASWDSDAPNEAPSDLVPLDTLPSSEVVLPRSTIAEVAGSAWPRLAAELGATVQAALPTSETRCREVAERLAGLQVRAHASGPDALVDEVAQACAEAQRVLQHRHHLMGQLGSLCQELTEGLADLSEDDSWVRGQCEVMRGQLFENDEGLTARGVRSVSQLLLRTRERQQALRTTRNEAREALKDSIHQMLDEIAALGAQTGRFSDHLDSYADAIDRAESLESLTGTVRQMVAESKAVHESVSQSQAKLALEHGRSSAMQTRVAELEDEIRRLSDEVSTDPLTQIANRRGLLQAFETERAKRARGAQGEGGELAVALIDIDNFKRLNDRLGHASGDAALQFLTHRVTQALRPGDTLARYGGEEFVVLLPATPIDEAQQVLTRVQRTLSAELFMSDEQGQVFVTFSAGVSLYRSGERLEQALERADEALYEAKHSGKNRTCIA
ncbi:diguanylate cyclase domain-containing protein [Methylibium sp.]|uniref:GGDEF domain-containing protein n=1 Tax=Methylibium sp. TaxID=2067992 RepID=UPI003D0FCE42